jgi:hypothetical protein
MTAPILSLAATAALGLVPGCHFCQDGGWQPPKSTDLGVSSNLHSVVAPGIAVGSAGTVVAWGQSLDGEPVVETSILADVELWGVTDAGGGRWVVVGDGGFAAVSDDWGQTWTTLDLGTSADLHAVLAVDESVIAVGDEVVRVRQADNTWLEPTAPQGGWGQLRAIGSFYPDEDPGVFAVGLGGVISSTTDPSGVWVAEDSGVSVDLFAVGPLQWTVGAVGASGTFLVREDGEWRPIETERTADFIDYQEFDPYGVLLAADGDILQFHLTDGFRYLDRIEGARDLAASSPYYELIAVGDAGLAVSMDRRTCE